MSLPAASPASPRRWPQFAWLAGSLLLLGFAYLPALTHGPYGINDDYQYLYRVYHRTFDPAHNEQMGMGRPLAAWALNAAYLPCAGLVARLVWLRGFALAGVILLVWTLGRTLTALRCTPAVAATVATLVGLSPAGGVYAAWAASMFSPYALTGALVAGRLMLEPRRKVRPIAGGLLLVAVCGTWQAAAPLALFPALIRAWQRIDQPPGSIPAGEAPWWQPWLTCAAAVAAYGAGCHLAARLGWTPANGGDRLALTNDLLAKVHLGGNLLRSGVTSWARFQPGRWEWITGGCTSLLCLGALLPPGLGRAPWPAVGQRTGLALTMLLLSVSPLLVARENNAAFRALPILYLTVAFLGVYGLGAWLAAGAAPVRLGVFLAVLAGNAGAARYHVWHGLVKPSVREYVGLRGQVRRQFGAALPARLVYLLPPPTLLAAPWLTPSWEYGLVSSPFWWVTRPFLLLIFAEVSPPGAVPADLTLAFREAGNSGVPVLHPLPVLLRAAGVWRDDPRLGRVQLFERGWLYSPWFGYLNVQSFPLIEHHILGTLRSIGSKPDELWLHKEGLGNFFTSRECFPSLYVNERKGWVFLQDTDRSHCQVRTAPHQYLLSE